MTEIVYGLVSGVVGVAIWQLLDSKLTPRIKGLVRFLLELVIVLSVTTLVCLIVKSAIE